MKYAERVLESIDGRVIRSELVPLDEAGDDCINICGHKGVESEDMFLYSIVKCAICGKGLGVS